MAINVMKQPPVAGRTTIIHALRDLNPPDSRLGGARLDISAPLGLYRLGLDQISEQSSLEHAEFIGWRYLLEGGGQRTGMADLAQAGSEPPRFANLARNEQADFLLQAAHIAEHVTEGYPDDCEARIIIVPSLYVSAVWITAKPPIFIPFLDVSHPIRNAEQVKVRPNFLNDIVERARVAREHRPELPTASMAP